MKLEKISIKNYRSIENCTIDNMRDLNIFIGKNDSGKTNILRAIELLFSCGGVNQEINQNKKAGGSGDDFHYSMKTIDKRMVHNQRKGTIEIIGFFNISDQEKSWLFPETHFVVEDEGNHSIDRDKLGNIIEICLRIDIDEDNNFSSRIEYAKLKNIFIIKIIGNHPSTLLQNDKGKYAFQGSTKRRIGSELVSKIRGSIVSIPTSRSLHLKPEHQTGIDDGSNIPEHFLAIEKDAERREWELFREIQKNLKEIFNEYSDISSKTLSGKSILYFDGLPSGYIGSGIEKSLIPLYNLLFYKDKNFLLLEEPELNLHADLQRKLFELIKKFAKNKQIFISTHSPIFTEVSDRIKNYLVTKGDRKTKVVIIKNRKDFENIKYELGAKNIDLFFYDCVVLIEGDTEEIAFPIISEAMEINFENSGIKLINIEGKDRAKLEKIREFLQYLKDSGIKIFVILDNDDKVEEYILDLEREGLIKRENSHIWKGEFEDCFEEEEIISAMKKIHGDDFDMTIEHLRKERQKDIKTSKILNKFIFKKELSPLSKPELGKNLGLLIRNGIESPKQSSKERRITEPEKVINRITELLRK